MAKPAVEHAAGERCCPHTKKEHRGVGFKPCTKCACPGFWLQLKAPDGA